MPPASREANQIEDNQNPTSKSAFSDTIFRTYAFDIRPSSYQPAITSTSATTVTTVTTNRNLVH